MSLEVGPLGCSTPGPFLEHPLPPSHQDLENIHLL